MVALYHVNDDFGVTVNVISERSGFACSVECVCSLSAGSRYLQVRQFFRMGMIPGAGCVK